ncbi:MAG: type II secretion system protein E [Deltaproteobacteria bacterium]|nr:type II secretion system protein E [Deltaproteobacteria bacterium]
MSSFFTFEGVLETLVERQVIEAEDARRARESQSAQRFDLARTQGVAAGHRSLEAPGPAGLLASFGLTTRDGKKLTEDRITEHLADQHGLPYVKIDPLKLDAQLITNTLSWPFARRHSMLVLSKSPNAIKIAIDDPGRMESIETVRSSLDREIEVYLATSSDLRAQIREVYGFRASLKGAEADLNEETDLGNLEQLVRLKSLEELETNDSHVVSAVDYLLRHAMGARASDIHVEPKREEAIVRLRIDGVLHTIRTIPRAVHLAVVNRVKTMARLDIAEKRKPQDGRIKTTDAGAEVELRVSTLPVAFGEKLVIRIFDPGLLLQDLSHLGLTDRQRVALQSFIGRPHGLILVTGPTGSGKTTTLYSALQALTCESINVTTIEDPIEMVVEDFNQTAIRPRAGITFASALRTLLRQDPDVIMVGEIRDRETAEQALSAALTGHLVLSTLHTNDAPTAVTRLLELGVEPFLVSSTLVGVIAQRLVRKLCPECAQPTKLSRQQVLALGIPLEEGEATPELAVSAGAGCVACRQTGLQGRTGVFEVLEASPRIDKLILAEASSSELMDAARQDGMRTLRESAIEKLASGETSFEEVLRVSVT